MSGIEVERCELQKIDKDPLDAKNVLQLDRNSNTVALEVLNDIVENALDSAMDKEKLALRNFRMVGDIVDQYTPRATKITDLCDVPVENKSQKPHLTTTEEDVKKFIGEISSPSPKGTGDQLQENDEIITQKKSFSLARSCNVEKKSRLTDLVRNSKSVISKFLSNENPKNKNNEWEEHSEEFVKSIELDQLNPDKNIPKSPKANKSNPITPSNSDEVINIPDDSGMENVNLKDLKDRGTDPGNEDNDMDYIQKSMTFPIASCSRLHSINDDCKEAIKDRKKWNFGSKIVNYIKKKASRRDITKSEV